MALIRLTLKSTDTGLTLISDAPKNIPRKTKNDSRLQSETDFVMNKFRLKCTGRFKILWSVVTISKSIFTFPLPGLFDEAADIISQGFISILIRFFTFHVFSFRQNLSDWRRSGASCLRLSVFCISCLCTLMICIN